MQKRKGEVITMTVVAVCIVAGLIGMFAAQLPMVKGILGFKDQKVINTTTTQPVWLKGPGGRQYLATQEVVLDQTTQVRQPLVETLKGWIIVLGILCIVFPGLAGWLIARGRASMKQIVLGVELAKKELSPDAVKKLETNLSKKADQSTKDLVKKVKSSLVKNGDIDTTPIVPPVA